MIERSQQLQDSARVQVFNSLWLHIYTTVYKELQSMDSSSMYDCKESITGPLPHCATAAGLGQGPLPDLQSQYFFKTSCRCSLKK